MGTPRSNLCSRCGMRGVRKRACAGLTQPYRMFAALSVPPEQAIPTCDRCGAQVLDAQTAEILAAALASAFTAELSHRAQVALAEICLYISQRRLEKLAGLSQGYLCRVLSGRSTPSVPLVALLTLLAQAPQERLRELEVAWRQPSGDPSPAKQNAGQSAQP